MKTLLYAREKHDIGKLVGHMDDTGIFYSYKKNSYGDVVGHADDKGIIYSHKQYRYGNSIGHVDNKGIICTRQRYDYGEPVGHVDAEGVIYNHERLELGYDVGHAEGSALCFAGAGYLLLWHRQQQTPRNRAAGHLSSATEAAAALTTIAETVLKSGQSKPKQPLERTQRSRSRRQIQIGVVVLVDTPYIYGIAVITNGPDYQRGTLRYPKFQFRFVQGIIVDPETSYAGELSTDDEIWLEDSLEYVSFVQQK